MMVETTVTSQVQHDALRAGSRRTTKLVFQQLIELAYGSHHDHYARLLVWLEIAFRISSPLRLVSQWYLSSDDHGSCSRPADETEEKYHLWVKAMVGTAFNIWSWNVDYSVFT